MDAELKAKWVAALRGENYKQGRGFLCFVGEDETTRFCCLGVALDIQGAEWETNKDDGRALHCKINGDLLRSNSTRLNLVGAFPGLSKEQIGLLMEMNDGSREHKQRTFPQIADWIEANIAPAAHTETARTAK